MTKKVTFLSLSKIVFQYVQKVAQTTSTSKHIYCILIFAVRDYNVHMYVLSSILELLTYNIYRYILNVEIYVACITHYCNMK